MKEINCEATCCYYRLRQHGIIEKDDIEFTLERMYRFLVNIGDSSEVNFHFLCLNLQIIIILQFWLQ